MPMSCASKGAEGIIRGFGAGAIWGAVSWHWNLHDKEFSAMRTVGRSGVSFALIAGSFNVTRCAAEKMRQKSDWMNSWAAGLAAGSVLAVRTQLTSVAYVSAIAAATSAFTGGFHYLSNSLHSGKARAEAPVSSEWARCEEASWGG